MIWQIALLITAVAFVVLVGVLIPTLVEVKKTARESSKAVAVVNDELVPLLREIKAVTGEFALFIDKAGNGMEHASMLFHAAGELGDRLQLAQERADTLWQRAHEVLSNTGGRTLLQLLSLGAGLTAMRRIAKNGKHHQERSGTHER